MATGGSNNFSVDSSDCRGTDSSQPSGAVPAYTTRSSSRRGTGKFVMAANDVEKEVNGSFVRGDVLNREDALAVRENAEDAENKLVTELLRKAAARLKEHVMTAMKRVTKVLLQ